MEEEFARLQQQLIQVSEALNTVIKEVTQIKAWIREVDNINGYSPQEFMEGGVKFTYDEFGNPMTFEHMDEKEAAHHQLTELEAQLEAAEENEDYNKCIALRETIRVLRLRFKNL